MISVIVPVLNEAAALPPMLQWLLAESGEFEVIVVDGGSTDDTAGAAGRFAPVRLLHSPRGRGAQMNAGAAASTGGTLLFLHADTQLPAGAIARLDAAMRSEARWEAGAFRHRFHPTDWRLRLVSLGNNLRCRRSRVFFGDQAIFVRRSLFDAVGGFPEVPVLEDVVFCERIRERTRAVLLPETVTTHPRRFLHHGVWRTTWRGLVILARHSMGLAPLGHGFTDAVR